jgi:Eco57I restriction endonuclease.
LLGQIVFLYFLQKKGWLGVPGNKNWGQGDRKFLRDLFEKCQQEKRNFFNDYLEFLFYDALNNEDRGGIDPSYYHRFDCRIPFLNGGLFNSDYDWVKTDIVIPDDIFSNRKTASDEGSGILDIFDLYNFTVKEDEPLEKEVAVDPEMLGKVFENLLEVKDRKSKGTYYTPREIVHYMCQESLINYLDTAINTGNVPLAKTHPPQGKLFGKPDPQQAALKAPQYRVLVPREDIEDFVRTGESTIEHDTRVETYGKETERYSYKLPESIRQNAKLVDDKLANIRVCDPAIGSGAFPLGMMHEIIRSRNTLTTYLSDEPERNNYNFKRHAIQNCLYGVDIDPGAVEIAKLRLWLSLVVDEEDIRQIKPLPNLDYKIVCGNSLLGVEKNLFNLKLFNNLEKLKSLYFSETNATKKQEYKSQIDGLINQITTNNENFDFEVYFSEVFHENGGFDVVIANPPYVSVKGISENEKAALSKIFVAGAGRFNLFTLFLEKGHKLLKENGILTFILPEGLYSNIEYRHIRKYILDHTSIILVNLFSDRVFEAAVDTSIISFMNKRCQDNQFNVFRDLNQGIIQFSQGTFNKLPYNLFLVNLTLNSFPIIYKLLENRFDRIESILEIQQGIIYSGQPKNRVFCNSQMTSDYKKY